MRWRRTGLGLLPAIGLILASASAASCASLTGTGFAVAGDGTLVTNEHVVGGCTTVMVRQGSQQFVASVLATDRANDLALVKLPVRTASFATLRRGTPVRLGEEVVAYGFPLAGALAKEGNLTVGYVSALRGLQDDEKTIQITAPVQRGNSGGPLVDLRGNVVGIVASKLDAMKIMTAMGDLPQNVNFAITAAQLKQFLIANTVVITEATSEPGKGDIAERMRQFNFGQLRQMMNQGPDSASGLSTADIAERLRRYTYFIECQRPATAERPAVSQRQAEIAPPGVAPAPVSPVPSVPPSGPALAAPANSGCNGEFAATRQLLAAGHLSIQATSQSPPAVKCQALLGYYSAMMAAREVFDHCDVGDQRAAHAAQLAASIDTFRQRMPAECTLR